MLRIPLALLLVFLCSAPSSAAVVWRSYSYFSAGGSTLDELMQQLSAHGPKVTSTGQRHLGATRIRFNTHLGYADNGQCRISEAKVTVRAKIILPRWRDRAAGDRTLRIFWDTLSSDIKRHEEGHVVIAKNFARDIETALLGLPPTKGCATLTDQAEQAIERLLAKYDAASERFDRIEGASFDRRIQSLYDYRIERIENGRLPEP